MIEQIKLLRKMVIIWLAVLTAILLIGGVYEDYRSCQRQEPVRALSVQRQRQLRAAWYQDAQRADDYAALDPNPQGRAVNAKYAAQRRALAASVKAAPPIDCSTFPPGR